MVSHTPISVTFDNGTPAEKVFVQMCNFGDSIRFDLLNPNRDNRTSMLTVCVENTPYKATEYWDFETETRYTTDIVNRGDACMLRIKLEAAGTKAFVLTDTADKISRT